MKDKPYRHLAHAESYVDRPIIFLSCTTFRRRKVLDNPIVHVFLHGIWQQSQDRNGWAVGHYMIMPDHVHVFVRAAETAEPMPKWIGRWKSLSSRMISRDLAAEKPVWQEDYFDRFLRTADTYTDKWHYVQQNPVRAGLVTNPADWPYQGCIVPLG